MKKKNAFFQPSNYIFAQIHCSQYLGDDEDEDENGEDEEEKNAGL